MKKLIATLGIAFVAAQAADAFLTLWATKQEFEIAKAIIDPTPAFVYSELNPFMVSFAHTWAFPFMKIVPAALIAWGLARLGRRYPKTRPVSAFGLVAAVAFLGGVLVSNVAEL